MVGIRQLYDLQQLDLEVASTEQSLTEVRARLADDSALVKARDRIAELEEGLAELEPARQQRERSIEQVKERLAALDSRLYGGVITSPRELAAAEDERSFLQSQHTDEEDGLLELMVEIDEAQSVRDSTTEELGRLEAAVETERPGLVTEETGLVAKLEGLRRERDEAVPQFSAHSLTVYERLRQVRNGYAVAMVARGMCQGCRITLPSAELQRVRSSQELVQCNSCQRILFVA